MLGIKCVFGMLVLFNVLLYLCIFIVIMHCIICICCLCIRSSILLKVKKKISLQNSLKKYFIHRIHCNIFSHLYILYNACFVFVFMHFKAFLYSITKRKLT